MSNRKQTGSDIEHILDFMKRLRANNNRPWFNEHKEEWKEIDASADRLTEILLARLSEFEPDCLRLNVSSCRYRIYRDTRFSPDKTPYKDHIGIFINPPGGKKSLRGGYYLHLEPGNCIVAAGVWCPDSKLLKMIRQSVYDEVEEYLEIIDNPDFRESYQTIGEDLLKTYPKDFPKDWEHINLLRPRSYTALGAIKSSPADQEKFIDEVVEMMRRAKPYNDFLNYTVDEYEQPAPGDISANRLMF